MGKSEDEISKNYSDLLDVWRQNEMKSMRDFLKYYNVLDVSGFVEAVKAMLVNYFSENFDLFKRTISLPNYARTYVYHSCNTVFPIFGTSDSDLYKIYRASSAGGPSIVFHRHAEKDKSLIRNNPLKPVKTIIGWDMNNMYGYAIAQNMPTGVYVQYRKERGFRAEPCTKYMDMYFWMDYVAEKEKIKITHKLNNKMREIKVKNFYCDGFSVSGDQITVYEFDSCYYHFDCPHCSLPFSGRDSTRAFQVAARKRTRRKRRYLETLGIRVVTMHECQFKKLIRPNIQHIVDRYMPPAFKPNKRFAGGTKSILRAVERDELFGAIYCDLRVPKTWADSSSSRSTGASFSHPTLTPHEYFEEMSPIFCVTDLGFDDFGCHMQDFCREAGMSDTMQRRLLVGGMSAERLLVSTSLLRWYLKHGIEVTAVHRVVQFTPRRCFQSFVEKATGMRRLGDNDPDKKMLSEKYKLFVNSLFGSFLRNKERERSLIYVRGSRSLRTKANDPCFVQCRKLDDDYYEVEMLKRRIRLDNPVYLGHTILNYAKELLLEFYYSFLDYYFSREDFMLMCCDTDSMYVAWSAEDIESLVLPERKDEYMRMVYGSCSFSTATPPSSSNTSCGDVIRVKPEAGFFLTRNCCERDRKWDAREPGLWKTEAVGTEMLCLSSKTYLLIKDGVADKMSCKGANKSAVTNAVETFRSVIDEKKSHSIENRGIRSINQKIVTYHQQRNAFHYMYIKRTVHDDGVTTKPVLLTLTPWPRKRLFISNEHPLSMWFEWKNVGDVGGGGDGGNNALFEHDGKRFFCLMQLALFVQLTEALHEAQYGGRVGGWHVEQQQQQQQQLQQNLINMLSEVQECSNAKDLMRFERRFSRQLRLHAFKAKQKAHDVVHDLFLRVIDTDQRIRNELLELNPVVQLFATGNDHYWSCGFELSLASVSRNEEFPGCNNFGKLLESLRSVVM